MSELSAEEGADLVFLHEEEKLAHDVYVYAHEVYGRGPFNNISASELQHTDAVGQLIERFGLEDPHFDATPGVFYDEALAGLYTALTTTVDASFIDALTVGATIEDLDIKDIEEMKARTSNSDLLDLYDRLQCGSRNHLRSYVGQLEMQGASYEAQYLTQGEVDEILAGDNESCGG